MIERIQKAIDSAIRGESRLPAAAAQVPGMIGSHVRHLLNNLCSEPGSVYLEIGVHVGASFVAALAGNEDTLAQGYAIDNFAGEENFRGVPKPEYKPEQFALFQAHMAKYLSGYFGIDGRIGVMNANLHEVSLVHFQELAFGTAQHVMIFYYDADHEQTQAGIQRFLPCLTSPAILLVDDWIRPNVRTGTREAIAEGGFRTIHEWVLKADPLNREGTWWQDFYVAAIERMA